MPGAPETAVHHGPGTVAHWFTVLTAGRHECLSRKQPLIYLLSHQV